MTLQQSVTLFTVFTQFITCTVWRNRLAACAVTLFASNCRACSNFDLVSGTGIRKQLSSLDAIPSQFHPTLLLKVYCLTIRFNIILRYFSPVTSVIIFQKDFQCYIWWEKRDMFIAWPWISYSPEKKKFSAFLTRPVELNKTGHWIL
jgi:hypothetical protein